jgi:hypothetical protein
MSSHEKVKKLYENPYDVKKLAEYQRIMMESIEAFTEVVIEGDKLQRQSPEYKSLTKYHVESHVGNQDYRKMFTEVVKRFTKKDNG